jgi:hypothetical protein
MPSGRPDINRQCDEKAGQQMRRITMIALLAALAILATATVANAGTYYGGSSIRRWDVHRMRFESRWGIATDAAMRIGL